MKNYNIAFVGLGSIATRHLKNVHTYLASQGENCEVDLYRSSLGRPLADELKPLVNNTYLYTDEIPADRMYDMVFVTNPTSMHYETLQKFKSNTKSFFIEKPVFDKTDVDLEIFHELKNVTCYVACPLRYNPVLQYVKENIALSKVYSARAISSSYLPDWRPRQDYRKCYSAHKDMGGGVAIDLIHEWDYLTWLFEMPQICYTIQAKISNLEIDSEDVALYISRTDNTMIELHLDYFGREPVRILQLFMHEDTVECDILGGKIRFLKSGEIKNFECERNDYQMLEIEHFFSIINHEIENDSTVQHAFDVLKLAKGEI